MPSEQELLELFNVLGTDGKKFELGIILTIPYFSINLRGLAISNALTWYLLNHLNKVFTLEVTFITINMREHCKLCSKTLSIYATA